MLKRVAGGLVAVASFAGPALAQTSGGLTPDFSSISTQASTVATAVLPVLVAVVALGVGLRLVKSGAKKIGF